MPRSRCCGRRRRSGAIIVLASGALYIAMKGRVAWYGLMQWALSDTLQPVGKVVLAIDRAAYILAFLLGAGDGLYQQPSRLAAVPRGLPRAAQARLAARHGGGMSDGGFGHCGCRGDGSSAPRRAASHLGLLDPAALDCHRGGVRGCSRHRDRQNAAQHDARLVAAVQLAGPLVASRRAVTSISIFTRGSIRPTPIMATAGRSSSTAPGTARNRVDPAGCNARAPRRWTRRRTAARSNRAGPQKGALAPLS